MRRNGRTGPVARAGYIPQVERQTEMKAREIAWSRRTRRAAGALAVVALMAAGLLSLAGCDRLLLTVPAELGTALAEERSVGEVIDDLTIRVALNHIFFSEDTDLHRAVSFSVVEGRALLTGTVPSSEAKARAVELAGRAAGVREVIDELQVGETPGLAAHAQDAWITAQLTLRMTKDLDVAHTNYDIGSVNGVVHMMGIAQDEEELSRAVGHARAISGVRRVANHVAIKERGRLRPATRSLRGSDRCGLEADER